MEIATNQDLYQKVTGQLKQRTKTNCSLERYLLRLWQLISNRPTTAPLGTNEFAAVLEHAFDNKPSATDYVGIRSVAVDEKCPEWRWRLAMQVLDLHEMELAGTLNDEYRYFGIDAPSGARWYNFDPHTYVECGLTGTFGGWAPGDASGRHHVPGQVAVMDEHGDLTTANPEDLEEPIYRMKTISWEEFADFLWSGQCYE